MSSSCLTKWIPNEYKSQFYIFDINQSWFAVTFKGD